MATLAARGSGGAEGRQPDFLGGWYGSLGNGPHTAPRAELHGLLKAAMFTKGDSKVVMGCLLIVGQYKGGRWRRPAGPNADLRQELGEIYHKRGKLEVSWQNAHATAEHVFTFNMELPAILGHEMADCLAHKGAALARGPGAFEEVTRATDGRSWKVLRRIVAADMAAARPTLHGRADG